MNNPILLPFDRPLKRAKLMGRRMRFLVDCEDGSETFTAHTNNTGSMMGLIRPGVEILLSESSNDKRKYKHTLEMVRFHSGLCGVNTLTPNRMLVAAQAAGLLPELAGYGPARPEAVSGKSRLDALFTGPSGPCWVEAKNVTMVEDEVACFPDAVTARGLKHLDELAARVKAGERAALFFLVQRPDGTCFGPADFIDPAYAERFFQVVELGVEAWPYRAVVTEKGVALGERLPLNN